jgi:hypothetical protein
VFIGPDQRRWFICTPTEGHVDLNHIKTQVATQWQNKSPTLEDCWPALFQANGTTWFVTRDFQTLMGYDGKQWIVHSADGPSDPPRGFVGVCPGHGMDGYRTNNFEADGTLFFIQTSGITTFDGKRWSFRAFNTGTGDSPSVVRLLLKRSSHGVLCFQMNPFTIWRYSSAVWKQVPLAANTPEPSGLGLGPAETLWLQVGRELTVIPLPDPSQRPAKSALHAPVFKIRGWEMDIRHRVMDMGQDLVGNIYVTVQVPQEVSAELTGTFVVKPDGSSEFFDGNRYLRKFGGYSDFGAPPPMGDGASAGWHSAYGSNFSVFRADPEGRPFAPQKPLIEGFRFVQALAEDKTVYLSCDDPLEMFRRGAQIPTLTAYHPDVPDTRPVLNLNGYDTAQSGAAVASDGAAWAAVATKGLCRFDGRQWQTMWGASSTADGLLFPGVDGSMLRWKGFTSEMFSMCSGNTRIDGPSLPTLILEHRKLFAQAFRKPVDPVIWFSSQQRIVPSLDFQTIAAEGGFSIAVDNQDRIWLAIDRKLSVLGNTWEWRTLLWPGPPPLPIPREVKNGPSLITPVGDGSAIYVADMKDATMPSRSTGVESKAYLVTLESSEPKWAEVPNATDGLIRAADGSLWVAYKAAPDNQFWGLFRRPIVLARIVSSGVSAQYIVPSAPVFMDSTGIIWLANCADGGERSGEFILWKDGKILGRVNVPGVWKDRAVTSDKPASVWVWTNLGLYHVTSSNPLNPASYDVKLVGRPVDSDGELYHSWGTTISACNQGLLLGYCRRDPYRKDRYMLAFLSTTNR